MKGRTTLRLLVVLLAWGLACVPAKAEPSWRLATVELPPAICSTLPDQGYLAVLLRRVLQEIGVQPQFVFLPPQRGYQGVLAGRFEGAYPYKRTPEREKSLWFSEPVFIATTRVFQRADDAWQPDQVAGLQGQRGCALQGSPSPPALQPLIDSDDFKLERVANLDACFRMLQAGRVRFVVAGLNSGWAAAHTLSGRGAAVRVAPIVLAEETVHLALPKVLPASAERLHQFNAALHKLKAQGVLKQLEAQHVPAPPTP